jgi:hypothetical protein
MQCSHRRSILALGEHSGGVSAGVSHWLAHQLFCLCVRLLKEQFHAPTYDLSDDVSCKIACEHLHGSITLIEFAPTSPQLISSMLCVLCNRIARKTAIVWQ